MFLPCSWSVVTYFATSNTHHLICCRPGPWEKKRWRLDIFGGSRWDNLWVVNLKCFRSVSVHMSLGTWTKWPSSRIQPLQDVPAATSQPRLWRNASRQWWLSISVRASMGLSGNGTIVLRLAIWLPQFARLEVVQIRCCWWVCMFSCGPNGPNWWLKEQQHTTTTVPSVWFVYGPLLNFSCVRSPESPESPVLNRRGHFRFSPYRPTPTLVTGFRGQAQGPRMWSSDILGISDTRWLESGMMDGFRAPSWHLDYAGRWDFQEKLWLKCAATVSEAVLKVACGGVRRLRNDSGCFACTFGGFPKRVPWWNYAKSQPIAWKWESQHVVIPWFVLCRALSFTGLSYCKLCSLLLYPLRFTILQSLSRTSHQAEFSMALSHFQGVFFSKINDPWWSLGIDIACLRRETQ